MEARGQHLQQPVTDSPGMFTPRKAPPPAPEEPDPTLDTQLDAPAMALDINPAPASVDVALDASIDEATHGRIPGIAAARKSPPRGSSSDALPVVNFGETLKNLKLVYLRLERLHFGDAGAAALANCLAGGAAAHVLKSLYIGSNAIGDEGALALAEALRLRPKCKLRKLYMDNNNRIGLTAYEALTGVCKARGVEVIGLVKPDPPPKPPRQSPPRSPRRSPPRPPSAAPVAPPSAAPPPSTAPLDADVG